MRTVVIKIITVFFKNYTGYKGLTISNQLIVIKEL